MSILPAGWEQLPDNTMRVWVDIRPRRNGEPNAIAAMQALAVASRVNPDAYDPEPVAAEQIALADGVTATGAGLLDGVIVSPEIAVAAKRDLLRDDDEGAPGEPPRCSTGGCGDD